MPVTDVLLMPISTQYAYEPASHAPLSNALEVAPGIQIARIKEHIIAAVVDATKFRKIDPTSSVLYGFVRYNPPGGSWDGDEAITRVLFLSHFVRAHEGGFEYTARIETNDRGKLMRMEPADIQPPYCRAYPCAPGQRNWLTQADAAELKNLVAAYTVFRPIFTDTKVGLAISLFADSPFVYQGRPRGLLLATTFEGLINTSPNKVRKQFTTGVPALAKEVGLPQLNVLWAERIYDMRCTLAHGSGLLGAMDEHARQTKLGEFNVALTDLDELLRRVLRRALIDGDFRKRLENGRVQV